MISDDLQTIDHDAGFDRATELMSERGVRRLPVTDADGELNGIIGVDDLNELLADERGELEELVRAQRPPY